MTHEQEEYIFYEEIGTGEEVAEETEEATTPHLNEEDVYKLTQDINDQDVRFEEQLDRQLDEEIGEDEE
ncbi:MAG TPA: hypothetical protein VLF41_01820 [Candidatus Nanoarchaeia archaeon]|nr:hypothetical protein [Candidatus Nanoarchaeia archaeon]